MRLPVTPQLSTKDDTANKNARLTNALREKDKAVVRPGLSLVLNYAGVGSGLVPWGDRLVRIFEDTIYSSTDPTDMTGGWIFDGTVAKLGQFDLGEYAYTPQTTMDFGQYSHTIRGIGTFGEIDLGEYPRIIRQFGTFGQFDLGEYAANMPNAFDPAYKYSSIVLSNRNRSVTSSDPQFGGALSTVFKSTGTGGKYYCEFTLVSVPGGFNIGIATAAFPLTSSWFIGRTSDSYGISPSAKWNNNISNGYGIALPAGTVVGMLLDTNANTLAFTVGGVSQGTAFSGLSGTFCPAVSVESGTEITANFGTTGWAYAPPVGYLAWF